MSRPQEFGGTAENPDVATSLENYAALLRRQPARIDAAERMEARAKAIRAKYQ